MPDRDLKHRKPYAYKKTRKVEGFLTEFAKAPLARRAQRIFAPGMAQANAFLWAPRKNSAPA
jgi:hypothetical protein